MLNNASTSLVFASFFFLYLSLSSHTQALSDNKHAFELLVKKDQRKSIVVSEYGEISAINIPYEIKRETYHIQFLTLEPNSLFLPAILNADMVFYVHTGSGRLSWVDEDEIKRVALRRGDIYRLQPGSVFQIQSSLENERQKLRIYAIFTNTDDTHLDPSVGGYSCIADLVRGFGSKTLQAAFKVPEEVIEAIKNSTERQMIVHAMSKIKNEEEKGTKIDLESRFIKALIQNKKKKKKTDAYNILDEDPDFKNSNGWSTTVTQKTTHLLKGSNVGVFMVNLNKGSMMGPHWNPKATEIAIVLQGQGMIRAVSSNITENIRFKVSEGDVFTVSRFHPMAQVSFNNETFVFMGFSTSTGKNHPQFLGGKNSVIQTLDKDVLAMSFGVTNSAIDRLLASQANSVILECPSCAEEMEREMEEEVERKREEEERRRREEEEKRKREKEARRRQEEERRREEEQARRRQEEEEEERRREEEEARRRQEEEEERMTEEEEARKRQEEEERRREEEEARKRKEEEERMKEEEEARRRQEEEERMKEEEEARKRQEEEERRREEEEARRRQEEEERREEEEQRKREQEGEEEEEQRRREDEWERKKRQHEEGRRKESEQEQARRQAEERERRKREEEEEEEEGDEGRRQEYEDEGKYLQLKMRRALF